MIPSIFGRCVQGTSKMFFCQWLKGKKKSHVWRFTVSKSNLNIYCKWRGNLYEEKHIYSGIRMHRYMVHIHITKPGFEVLKRKPPTACAKMKWVTFHACAKLIGREALCGWYIWSTRVGSVVHRGCSIFDVTNQSVEAGLSVPLVEEHVCLILIWCIEYIMIYYIYSVIFSQYCFGCSLWFFFETFVYLMSAARASLKRVAGAALLAVLGGGD